MRESLPGGKSEAASAAIGGAVGIGADVVVGLDRAAAQAGDVLRDVVGGLPWELAGDVSELVSALVVGGVA